MNYLPAHNDRTLLAKKKSNNSCHKPNCTALRKLKALTRNIYIKRERMTRTLNFLTKYKLRNFLWKLVFTHFLFVWCLVLKMSITISLLAWKNRLCSVSFIMDEVIIILSSVTEFLKDWINWNFKVTDWLDKIIEWRVSFSRLETIEYKCKRGHYISPLQRLHHLRSDVTAEIIQPTHKHH